MREISRRDWGFAVLGGLAAALPVRAEQGAAAPAPTPRPTPKPAPVYLDSRIKGVQLGVQSYSFRDRTLAEAIQAMAALGIGSCELWQGHVEPKELSGPAGMREDLRRWRMSTPLDFFQGLREQLDQAGVRLDAYNLSFRNDFTDAEMERCCLIAGALGVPLITSSANVSMVRRFDFFARQHRLRVGLHNHSVAGPDELATPEDLESALAGTRVTGINLDLGHFVAAGFDGIEYLTRHHARIFCLHLKDRKRGQGPNVPWGEGDAPLAEALRLVRDRKWPIPVMIEYEYAGADTIDEVRRCLEFCRKALGA
jgi:sugar phosphate isomerase/epimerase